MFPRRAIPVPDFMADIEAMGGICGEHESVELSHRIARLMSQYLDFLPVPFHQPHEGAPYFLVHVKHTDECIAAVVEVNLWDANGPTFDFEKIVSLQMQSYFVPLCPLNSEGMTRFNEGQVIGVAFDPGYAVSDFYHNEVSGYDVAMTPTCSFIDFNLSRGFEEKRQEAIDFFEHFSPVDFLATATRVHLGMLPYGAHKQGLEVF